jgi:hypothetical protein
MLFFIVCVSLCAVFCLSVVCYFVLCLILVPLPPGKKPFAVQLSNDNNSEIYEIMFAWCLFLTELFKMLVCMITGSTELSG